jgi:hypothetical protein
MGGQSVLLRLYIRNVGNVVGPGRTLGGSQPEHRTLAAWRAQGKIQNGKGERATTVRPSTLQWWRPPVCGIVGLGSMECLDLLVRCRSTVVRAHDEISATGTVHCKSSLIRTLSDSLI